MCILKRSDEYSMKIEIDQNGLITTKDEFLKNVQSQWAINELAFKVGLDESAKAITDITNLWNEESSAYAEEQYEQAKEFAKYENDSNKDETIEVEWELGTPTEDEAVEWLDKVLDWDSYIDDFITATLDTVAQEFPKENINDVRNALIKVYQAEPTESWVNTSAARCDNLVWDVEERLDEMEE